LKTKDNDVMTIFKRSTGTDIKGARLRISSFERPPVSNPLTIYRDIDSMAAVITYFKAMVTAVARSRLFGLCGFDSFIDTFVRLQTPSSMAKFIPKVAATAAIALIPPY
jgi:hypothetical protein